MTRPTRDPGGTVSKISVSLTPAAVNALDRLVVLARRGDPRESRSGVIRSALLEAWTLRSGAPPSVPPKVMKTAKGMGHEWVILLGSNACRTCGIKKSKWDGTSPCPGESS